MMNVEWLTTFLGWCTVINVIGLALATLMFMLMREFVTRLHSKMMGVPQADMPIVYMQYLSNYKVAAIMFNLVPYIALRIMAA